MFKAGVICNPKMWTFQPQNKTSVLHIFFLQRFHKIHFTISVFYSQKAFEMLEEFKLSKVPETVFCIPDFVSEQEEENTLRNINKAPKVKWTNLLNRRLQNWGGLPKEKV